MSDGPVVAQPDEPGLQFRIAPRASADLWLYRSYVRNVALGVTDDSRLWVRDRHGKTATFPVAGQDGTGGRPRSPDAAWREGTVTALLRQTATSRGTYVGWFFCDAGGRILVQSASDGFAEQDFADLARLLGLRTIAESGVVGGKGHDRAPGAMDLTAYSPRSMYVGVAVVVVIVLVLLVAFLG